ncbi:MAG: hypothetical protein WCI20_09090 [bacterium]
MTSSTNEIILLTDYRGAFWSSLKNRWGLCSLDIEALRQAFGRMGYQLQVLPFAEVSLRGRKFRDQPVLYHSSEDKGSHYKDYLEDVLLGIQLQGGRLIPPFHCFRAHHNKVFMEILRDLSNDPVMMRPQSRVWGTLEDFQACECSYPAVFKKAWGAGSSGVQLAHGREEGLRIAARFSRSASVMDVIKEHIKRWRRRKMGYVPYSMHRQKFLVQEFIPGLQGDFKVLVYWDRYYVVSRNNRPGDFRASGSGLLTWPEDPPGGLLEYAQRVFNHFRVPMISLDIAMTDDGPVLIEFQFVCFGPASLELSNWFFQRQEQGGWLRKVQRSLPEVEFARSVCCYLALQEERNES